MRKPLPTLRTYGVWILRSAQRADSISLTITAADEDDLPEIERVRPGYASMASDYLRHGHRGVLLWQDDRIAGMGWYVTNTTPHTIRTKGYYPLLAGRALFHADWIHPDYRGLRLHTVLIASRVERIRTIGDVSTIEAAIEPENVASIRNYEHLGFSLDRRLTVMSWGRWTIARSR